MSLQEGEPQVSLVCCPQFFQNEYIDNKNNDQILPKRAYLPPPPPPSSSVCSQTNTFNWPIQKTSWQIFHLMEISKLVFAPPSVCFETNTFNVFFTNTNKTFWQIRHLMVISKVVFASPSVCSGSQRGAAPRAGRGCLRQLGYCSSQTNSLNTFWQIQQIFF